MVTSSSECLLVPKYKLLKIDFMKHICKNFLVLRCNWWSCALVIILLLFTTVDLFSPNERGESVWVLVVFGPSIRVRANQCWNRWLWMGSWKLVWVTGSAWVWEGSKGGKLHNKKFVWGIIGCWRYRLFCSFNTILDLNKYEPSVDIQIYFHLVQ